MIIYRPKGAAGEYGKYAVNLYSGCSMGCRYCYVPPIMHKTREDFQANVRGREDILIRLQKEAPKHKAKNGNGDPIFLSFSHDPYQPMEKDLRLTRGAIEILKQNGLTVRILTKGGKLACRDFDLLGDGDFFGVTLTDPSSDYVSWEPYAPPPEERMDTLKEAHHREISTWVSLEPVLSPNHAYEVIKRTHSYVDEYKIGKLNHHEEIERTINWKTFREMVIAMLEGYGNKYFIKADLLHI